MVCLLVTQGKAGEGFRKKFHSHYYTVFIKLSRDKDMEMLLFLQCSDTKKCFRFGGMSEHVALHQGRNFARLLFWRTAKKSIFIGKFWIKISVNSLIAVFSLLKNCMQNEKKFNLANFRQIHPILYIFYFYLLFLIRGVNLLWTTPYCGPPHLKRCGLHIS